MNYREEQDTMGTVRVPEDAYYGAQTQRAKDNFVISNLNFPSVFYKALGMIKKHAARVNQELGLIRNEIAEVIIHASDEMINGRFNEQFVVDVFQTGSGTSTHMNANEIIAGRANELITGRRGGKSPVHPNDHVNKGQSSNDVIPSSIHIAAWVEINDRLLPAMQHLQKTLTEKSQDFKNVRKIANDIRWLSSGPRCGLGEIILPDLQPGSSIMPGNN